jgi:hypothetical protein
MEKNKTPQHLPNTQELVPENGENFVIGTYIEAEEQLSEEIQLFQKKSPLLERLFGSQHHDLKKEVGLQNAELVANYSKQQLEALTRLKLKLVEDAYNKFMLQMRAESQMNMAKQVVIQYKTIVSEINTEREEMMSHYQQTMKQIQKMKAISPKIAKRAERSFERSVSQYESLLESIPKKFLDSLHLLMEEWGWEQQ